MRLPMFDNYCVGLCRHHVGSYVVSVTVLTDESETGGKRRGRTKRNWGGRGADYVGKKARFFIFLYQLT